MSLAEDNRPLLDPIRVKAQRRSHAYLRKFSDEAFLEAYAKDHSAVGLAKKLHCYQGTIRYHAARLGLRLRGNVGSVWTPEQDEQVRQCGLGKTTVSAITRTTRHSSLTIARRAEQLGVTLVLSNQGQIDILQGERGMSQQYDNPITVGKVDRLLRKLREEFGSSRRDIYPGVKAS